MNQKKNKGHWIKKFGYAFRGFYTSIKEEGSLVVHIIVALIVLMVSTVLYKQMTPLDWVAIVLVICIVIGVELLNTAIENVVDVISFKYNYNAKKIKDISAAATLVFTLGAIAVGLIIFIPKIIDFVHSF